MSDPREAALAQKAMARESDLVQCRRELARVTQERDEARAAIGGTAGAFVYEQRDAAEAELARVKQERDEARALLRDAAKHLRSLPAKSQFDDQAMWTKIETFLAGDDEQ